MLHQTKMSSNYTLVLMTLCLMTSLCICHRIYEDPCHSDPICEELKCLKTKPASDCSVKVIYQDPLGEVTCGHQLTWDKALPLAYQPKFNVPKPKGEFSMSVLVLMYRPDIPIPQPGLGYIHLAAKGTLNKDGGITDLTAIMSELKYEYPIPTYGVKRRYQVFVFPADGNKEFKVPESTKVNRQDRLCDFMKRNDLSTPIASTEFS